MKYPSTWQRHKAKDCYRQCWYCTDEGVSPITQDLRRLKAAAKRNSHYTIWALTIGTVLALLALKFILGG